MRFRTPREWLQLFFVFQLTFLCLGPDSCSGLPLGSALSDFLKNWLGIGEGSGILQELEKISNCAPNNGKPVHHSSTKKNSDGSTTTTMSSAMTSSVSYDSSDPKSKNSPSAASGNNTDCGSLDDGSTSILDSSGLTGPDSGFGLSSLLDNSVMSDGMDGLADPEVPQNASRTSLEPISTTKALGDKGGVNVDDGSGGSNAFSPLTAGNGTTKSMKPMKLAASNSALSETPSPDNDGLKKPGKE